MLEIEVVGIRDRLEEAVEVSHFTQQPSSAYPGLMQMEGHPQPTWREMDNKCTLGGKICLLPLEPNPVAKTVRSACYPAFRSRTETFAPTANGLEATQPLSDFMLDSSHRQKVRFHNWSHRTQR